MGRERSTEQRNSGSYPVEKFDFITKTIYLQYSLRFRPYSKSLGMPPEKCIQANNL